MFDLMEMDTHLQGKISNVEIFAFFLIGGSQAFIPSESKFFSFSIAPSSEMFQIL